MDIKTTNGRYEIDFHRMICYNEQEAKANINAILDEIIFGDEPFYIVNATQVEINCFTNLLLDVFEFHTKDAAYNLAIESICAGEWLMVFDGILCSMEKHKERLHDLTCLLNYELDKISD